MYPGEKPSYQRQTGRITVPLGWLAEQYEKDLSPREMGLMIALAIEEENPEAHKETKLIRDALAGKSATSFYRTLRSLKVKGLR
jgi:hypothetical protein